METRKIACCLAAAAILFALAVPTRAGESCGDGSCGAGEDANNCPQDCGCAALGCLDGTQAPGGCYCDCLCVDSQDCCPDAEAECNLSADCVCGDGACDNNENDGNCPEDCGCAALGCVDDTPAPAGCFCDCLCLSENDCCADAEQVCSLSTACATGACCLPDGTCTADGTQADCESASGNFQGDTTCDLAACPQPGACCFEADGRCQVLSEGFCALDGGFFQGPGTACDPNPCPQPGACCFEADGRCQVLSEGFCALDGGFFQGPGTVCDPDPCVEPTGACCYDDLGMAVAGKDGPLCEELTSADCAARAGHYGGDGTACDPGACGPGACCLDLQGVLFCFDDGFATACPMQFGQFSPGQTCDQANCPELGACCVGPLDRTTAGIGVDPCVNTTEEICATEWAGTFQGPGTSCHEVSCNPERVDISTKGSLLIFSDVELEFTQGPVAGTVFNITKDTIISLTNDYPGEVYVQMYFINGDPEKDAIFSGGPIPILISEQEPGCNWVDCAVLLTPDQPVYWSAASGNPVGCQPFAILDPDLGNGPGRPNPDVLGGPRVLRGYIVAWAVDAEGRQIDWNHLSGKATIVDYAAQAAWEYSPWAFQALTDLPSETPTWGRLQLDGMMYENAFDMLLFDFFAAGSMALSSNGNVVSVDTDLTLHPVTHDLRQEHRPPVTTKAHFDIWNMNERKLSNTRRCITCWDQVLLSQFGAPNNFLLANLQSDKGKARIDGKQADECEETCFRDMNPSVAPQDNQTAGFLDDLLELDFVCSQDAALLGVAAKILRFGNNSIDYAGSELVGMGVERAFILYDVVGPPGTLRDDTYDRIRPVQSKPTRIGGARGK